MNSITEFLFNMWIMLNMIYTTIRLIDLISRWDER